ncbi:uncharacterized protein [Miscanthus floridulus]|uniref:uncharacterized protein isoform X5 n=1 Tax=Miscanthus floridulus TaxID=154761 RepID=UPI003458E28B
MTHHQLLPRTPGERSGNSPGDAVVAVSPPPPPLLRVLLQHCWQIQDVFPASVRLSVQVASRSSSLSAASSTSVTRLNNNGYQITKGKGLDYSSFLFLYAMLNF